ncbi:MULTISPECIES: TRAP transporter small permease [Actinomycetes]
MVATTADVINRNVAGRSVAGLLEMSESALVACVFLGLAYAGATNAHVSVDLLTSKLPLGAARRLAGVVWTASATMVVWLLVATTERAIQSTEIGEIQAGMMDWPVWPARWLIVVGYLSFLIIALINAYLSFRNEPLLGEDDEPDPPDQEVISAPNPSGADGQAWKETGA